MPTSTTPAAAKTFAIAASGITPWFDDALPTGARAMTYGRTWKWVSSGLAPFSGTTTHRGLSAYESELRNTNFPADRGDGSDRAEQDRWANIWNVTAELATVQQARLDRLLVPRNSPAAFQRHRESFNQGIQD
jgi:hypothetical protein